MFFGFDTMAEAEEWNLDQAAGRRAREATLPEDKESRREACRNRPVGARWMRTRSDTAAVEEGCWFDAVAAEQVCDWIEHRCRQQFGDDAGKNIVLLPWQRDFCMRIFGWKLPSGARRIRKALLWMAKKNGKTTLAAALALYMLVGSREKGPRVYCVAATVEQGKILYDEAVSMIQKDGLLRQEVFSYESKREIKAPVTQGEMYLLAAKVAKVLDGKNIYFAIIDEYHTQKTRKLFDILNDGIIGRKDGLTMVLSTTGEDDDGPLPKLVDQAYRLLDPDGDFVDTSFMPFLYTAAAELAWDSEEAVAAANPSYGKLLFWENFAAKLPDCRTDPLARADYERKHLNRFAGAGEKWVDMLEWAACGGAVEEKMLEGTLCYGGLDLSKVRDFSAFIMIFPRMGGGFKILPHFWLPNDNADVIAAQTNKPIRDWADHGLIELTSGNVIDYARIEDRIVQFSKRFQIQAIGYDPWKAMDLVLRLQDNHGLNMVEVKQNFESFSGPSQELSILLGNGSLAHGGNPIMAWHAKCLEMKSDLTGNCRPIRPEGRVVQDRIDGMIGLIMSLAMAKAIPPKKKGRFRAYTGGG